MNAQPEKPTYEGQIRPVIFWPDKKLKVKSLPVPDQCLGQPALIELVHDMMATMYALGGVGLSAIQVGVPWRLFVMDVTTNLKRPSEPRVFINPEIEALKPLVRLNEGCLSLPSLKVPVERPERLRLKGVTHYGTPLDQEYAGWHARVILHEFDHLDGFTIMDRLKGIQLRQAKKSMRKFHRQVEQVDSARIRRRS